MKKGETMSYLDRVQQATQMSRRGFVATTAAATAALAATSLAGCSTNKVEKTEEAAVTTGSDGRDIINGEWKAAACWHNCGGRCVNKVLVKDGVVIRQKTDDSHEDSADYPQQRSCLRGHAQRKQVFAADRLKYPMKRKNWSPDNPNGDLRGIDEWERISWDEAYKYIADGLQKAKEQYGNRSILLLKGWNSELTRTLGLFGGFTNFWDTNSYGSWDKCPNIIGFNVNKTPDQTINDRYDLRNCETIVMMAMNPAWSAAGSQMLNYLEAKKAGAKFIYIDPMYCESAAALDAEWLPIRPATDMPFMFGLAYAMLEQDDKEGIINWDFLNKCTVGFDADHMPADAKDNKNFKDYVMGAYDGTPKTPEWASEICGIEADAIRKLAVTMGKKNKVAFLSSAANARVNNVDSLPQLVMTIGAMGGHMGKSGHMTGTTMHCTSGNGGYALVTNGKDGLPKIENPVDDAINGNEVWDAILNGHYKFTGTGHYDPAEQRDIDIHVIYSNGGNKLQTNVGMTKGIEAFRKVDMVVSHAQFYTTSARYSDIVLPISTEWERAHGLIGGNLVHKSNREMVQAYERIIDPMFESKSDQDIACELGEKLGLKKEDIYPFDAEQQFFNVLTSMKVIDADGKTEKNAVKVTDDDIKALGVDGSAQDGELEYTELMKRGVYQVERHVGDNYGYIALEDFCKDPEKNPVDTPSGKLEIYSQSWADMVNAIGWSTIEPIPTYIPVANGYESSFADWGSKTPGEYPLQVINPHYLRRAHTAFDNVSWLREAWTNPVFISREDAAAAGIADGDTVLLTSPVGKCVRPATVTARVRPGVVALPHGAWVQVDEETGIDQAGADNYLIAQTPTGAAVSGYNSALCKIEKYTGTALGADADLPARMPLKDGE